MGDRRGIRRSCTSTRVNVVMDRALQRAEELPAFLRGVGYKRYGTRARDHVG